MNVSRVSSPTAWLLCGGLFLASAALSGCQTHIGGQTLPSAYYLRDDVQYFPAGPEFKLTNAVQAAEEYKATRGQLERDLQP